MDAGGGLLGDALDALGDLGPPGAVLLEAASSTPSTTCHSSLSSSVGSGTLPAASYSTPLCTRRVASPPSSRIMFGPPPSGQRSACSVHHQYSSSVSPFQANTGTPRGSSMVPVGPTATAAAAWSWVEKMLQLTQRTSAPRAVRVSMSTAVWMVMCSEPVMRAPRSGWASACSARRAMRPGISCSASSISLRPPRGEGEVGDLGSRRRSGMGDGPPMRVGVGRGWDQQARPSGQPERPMVARRGSWPTRSTAGSPSVASRRAWHRATEHDDRQRGGGDPVGQEPAQKAAEIPKKRAMTTRQHRGRTPTPPR